VEAQVSRVTALCWAQTFSLWVLDQPATCKNRAAESLLVGRLDGSLCWLQVTMQEMELHVKNTELTHCHRKEGEEAAIHTYYMLLLTYPNRMKALTSHSDFHVNIKGDSVLRKDLKLIMNTYLIV